MTNILNFQGRSGKQRGLLAIYMLNSLKRKPKTGYDMLAEIKEKTEGTWIPSKGTIYPLLKQLKEEGLIRVKSTGKRSKNIFEITNEGKKVLSNIKKHGRQMEKKIIQFRNLLADILEKRNVNITRLIMDIKETSFVSSKEKKEEVIKTLEHCLSDLKGIR